MTRVVLVRHGETVWHAENRYAGVSDIDLTVRGREQATVLAEWARSANLAALWVSPLKRARESAAPAAKITGLIPKVDVRLREIDFGRGEGLTMAEMKQQFGMALQAFLADPVENRLPGSEHPVDVAGRCVECLRDLASHYSGKRVLVVAHNTLFRLALCRMLEIPLAKYRIVFPSLRNGALTEIGIDGERTSLLSFNVPLPRTFDLEGEQPR